MRSHKILDTSGLNCPQVLLKAKLALKNLKSGQVLKIISTDPSSVLDFKVFCATNGHGLKKQEKKSHEFIFWLQKK